MFLYPSPEVHSEPEAMGESVSSPADAWHQDLSLLLAEGGVRGKGVWSVRHAETERDVSMFPLLGHGAGGGPCEGIFLCN
jgi:hypothetical protein